MKARVVMLTFVVAASAHAQMSPVSRFSRVYAWEHFFDLSGNDLGVQASEFTTSDFDPFDIQATGGGYTAIQHSTITPSLVSIETDANGLPVSHGFGQAESDMTYVFTVAQSVSYDFSGDVHRFIGPSSVSLMGPGVNDFFEGIDSATTPFSFQGTLSPGQYTLDVVTTSDFGAVNATLSVVPTPEVGTAIGLGALYLFRRPARG